jgi:hypothetical protein
MVSRGHLLLAVAASHRERGQPPHNHSRRSERVARYVPVADAPRLHRDRQRGKSAFPRQGQTVLASGSGYLRNIFNHDLRNIRDKTAALLVTRRDDAGKTVNSKRLPVHFIRYCYLIAAEIRCDLASAKY